MHCGRCRADIPARSIVSLQLSQAQRDLSRCSYRGLKVEASKQGVVYGSYKYRP